MARRKLAVGPLMALGATAGLLAATRLGPEFTLPLAAAGAAAGAVWSYLRLPDAPVCKIPRIVGGCGGETTVRDTAGNSRPRRPCWGHPDGKPKRVVNLAVVASEVAFAAVLVVVAVVVARSGA